MKGACFDSSSAGKDGTKKPLKDVSVTVKDNGNTYVTGRSNSNGEIEFSRAETALFEKELQVIVGRQPTDSSVRTDRLGNFTINLVIEAPEALSGSF